MTKHKRSKLWSQYDHPHTIKKFSFCLTENAAPTIQRAIFFCSL